MQIAPTTAPSEQPAPDGRRAPAEAQGRRPTADAERPLRTAVEPRTRVARPLPVPAQAPRWIEAERDYRAPTPVERARLLRAAYEAAAPDPEQRLLLAELMAYYRSWCLRQGLGDPFVPEVHVAPALRAD